MGVAKSNAIRWNAQANGSWKNWWWTLHSGCAGWGDTYWLLLQHVVTFSSQPPGWNHQQCPNNKHRTDLHQTVGESRLNNQHDEEEISFKDEKHKQKKTACCTTAGTTARAPEKWKTFIKQAVAHQSRFAVPDQCHRHDHAIAESSAASILVGHSFRGAEHANQEEAMNRVISTSEISSKKIKMRSLLLHHLQWKQHVKSRPWYWKTYWNMSQKLKPKASGQASVGLLCQQPVSERKRTHSLSWQTWFLCVSVQMECPRIPFRLFAVRVTTTSNGPFRRNTGAVHFLHALEQMECCTALIKGISSPSFKVLVYSARGLGVCTWYPWPLKGGLQVGSIIGVQEKLSERILDENRWELVAVRRRQKKCCSREHQKYLLSCTHLTE